MPMQPVASPAKPRVADRLGLARAALGTWGPRQVGVAAVAAVGTALVIGLATVLIPNPIFGREIPPVWWDYPVWILTAVLCGVLIATYVDPQPRSGARGDRTPAAGPTTGLDARTERRTSRLGMTGGVLAWFAVGCPVCNKLALLALGYSGAMTWFAPFQPILAVTAIAATFVAIVLRLEGQMRCTMPAARAARPAPV